MTKLNLSALKKQAWNISPKQWEWVITLESETTGEAWTSVVNSVQDVSVTSDISSVSESSVPSVPLGDGGTSASVREFFPNLTVSTKYEMDEVLINTSKTQSVIMSEGAVTSETTAINILSTEPTTDSTLTFISNTPESGVVINSIAEESSTVEVLPTETLQTETVQDPVYVQAVAEDLSKTREWGLARFSLGKKVALVSLSGILICTAVFAGLYSLGIFPISKASVIESPASPIIVAVVSTGSINTGSTSTGTVNPSATWSIILASTGTTGVTSSGMVTSYSGSLVASTGSTILTGSGTSNTSTGTGVNTNSWAAIPSPKQPENMSSTWGAAPIIRTPNIRTPRIK